MESTIVERARRLVGTRFRPQGRLETHGLDCAGVVMAACNISAGATRHDYRLRGPHLPELIVQLARHFDLVADERQPGDVLLMQVAKDQFHLAVHCGSSFVHAHAGIGKVVETPGEPSWPLLQTYRIRRNPQEN